MSFRNRLMVIFTVAILAAVGVVDLLVLGSTRQAFERSEAQRAEALVLQFRKEFDRRRSELVRTVNAIAASEATRNIAIQPDYSQYFDYAVPQAATHDLQMLELVTADGGGAQHFDGTTVLLEFGFEAGGFGCAHDFGLGIKRGVGVDASWTNDRGRATCWPSSRCRAGAGPG